MNEGECFDELASKIGNLLYRRSKSDNIIISKTLDAINCLNYRYTIITNPTKALLLVNQCCSYITPDDDVLVQKCSKLIINISTQNIIIEGRTLTISVQWCIEALKLKKENVVIEVLYALESLIRISGNVDNVTDHVLKGVQPFLQSLASSVEVKLAALQCLKACTNVPEDYDSHQTNDELSNCYLTCAEIFNDYLIPQQKMDVLIQSKIKEVCLMGLQNIITRNPDYLKQELGKILGVIKSYMLYGVKGLDFVAPQILMPSTLDIPEVPSSLLRENTGGKVTKQRKYRPARKSKKDKKLTDESFQSKDSFGYSLASMSFDPNSLGCGMASYRIKTSDSDFSDTEGGRQSKIRHTNTKVRQAALNLFHQVVKETDKSVMFSYWSSFIPEGPISGKYNLLTCILKEPSVRCRIAALNVLLLLLKTSKFYLLQAESSGKNTAFTPFAVVLGLMLIELHKALRFALSEMSLPILPQILKCLGALVQATPYHKMAPGLITKVFRNVKELLFHKDSTVQVTALIVVGCLLASEPVVPETREVMLKIRKEPKDDAPTSSNSLTDSEDFDYAQFSSDDEIDDSFSDETNMPWLIRRCLDNLGVSCGTSSKVLPDKAPAPVKLESIKILSAMSRKYFDTLMVAHLKLIARAFDISLKDTYADIRFHAGRAIDFIAQAIMLYVSNEESKNGINFDNCNAFWQILLNDSLIHILQHEQDATIRAVACDCIGSIGPQLFELLSRDKQILCITLLFSCSRDDDTSVKGAAVRALAICALYPSLREDMGFIIDVAEVIIQSLKEANITIKIKASWSLGNLSDALVYNSKSNELFEEVPDSLIVKLLQSSTASSTDSDKVKMNAVRSIGNLLLLVDETRLEQEQFVKATEEALNALVKCCNTGTNMKVRWNACYAVGNALKNQSLYMFSKNWQQSVFNSLLELVVKSRNFKVRINAAAALSASEKRDNYGAFYFSTWLALMKALENSHNLEDFTEYKHRDHLVDQICLTLCHLTSLVTPEDLMELEDVVTLHFELFKSNMGKVVERLVPEKSGNLFSATSRLKNFDTALDLTTRQIYVINCLKDVFIQKTY